MAAIINLRRARKAKQREEKSATAAEMRARFGRSKDERSREATRQSLAEQRHDGHKLDEV